MSHGPDARRDPFDLALRRAEELGEVQHRERADTVDRLLRANLPFDRVPDCQDELGIWVRCQELPCELFSE